MTHSLIDPVLVEQRILALAQHGAYGETGVWRTVYSPEWARAADLYAQWCREAGLTVARDPVGNVWGRLQGSEGGTAISWPRRKLHGQAPNAALPDNAGAESLQSDYYHPVAG